MFVKYERRSAKQDNTLMVYEPSQTSDGKVSRYKLIECRCFFPTALFGVAIARLIVDLSSATTSRLELASPLLSSDRKETTVAASHSGLLSSAPTPTAIGS